MLCSIKSQIRFQERIKIRPDFLGSSAALLQDILRPEPATLRRRCRGGASVRPGGQEADRHGERSEWRQSPHLKAE